MERNITNVRYLLVTLSLMGLLAYFFIIKRFLGHYCATLSTAIFAVSTHAIYWSRFTFHHVGVFYLTPGIILLVLGWVASPTILRSMLCGILIGLGLFCYPGITLFFVSSLLALLVLIPFYPMERQIVLRFLRTHVLALFTLLGSLAAVICAVFAVHKLYLVEGMPFGVSGGGGPLTVDVLMTNLLYYLIELLIEIRSFYFQIPDYPFFDSAFFGFVLLGIYSLTNAKRGRSFVPNFLVLLALLSFLSLSFTGQLPSIRRGLPLLFVLAIFTAEGMLWLASTTHKTSWSRPIFVVLLTASFAIPMVFQLAIVKPILTQVPHHRIPVNSGVYDNYFEVLKLYNHVFNFRQ